MTEIFFNEFGLKNYGDKYRIFLIEERPHGYYSHLRYKTNGTVAAAAVTLHRRYFEPIVAEEYLLEFKL